MNRFFLLLVFVFGAFAVQAQNPGGIGNANLSAWFKAESLSNGNATSWTTSYPTGGAAITLTDASAPYAQVTNIPTGAVMNYNTCIDFAGNSAGSSQVLQNTSAMDLLNNSNINDQGTFITVYYLPANRSCTGCHVVNYREATSGIVDGIQFRVNLNGGNGRLAIGSGNSPNASRDFIQDFKPDIITYTGNRSGASTMSLYKRSSLISGGGSSGTTGTQALVVGARLSGGVYNAVFDGYLAEILFYNRDLTSAELAKVHSYLAIKYGITLNNFGGGTQGDLVASDGTVVWDASVHPVYHNDLFGIARDDIQGLLQKQSHTLDDTSRVYLASLQSSNSANTGIFSADTSFITIGHNSDQMCATGPSNQEVPTGNGIYSRLEREWRVTKSNMGDEFGMDFVLSSCSGVINPMDLVLLVDDDGNFNNATKYGQGLGLVINYANNTVSVSGISNAHIPNNSTRYLTIASASPTTTIASTDIDKFVIYPNPATDQLTIRGNIKQGDPVIVNNVLGKDLSKELSFDRTNPNEITIDINVLSEGFYFLNIGETKKTFLKIK